MSTNVNSSTTNQWLLKAKRRLEKANISTARLDCLVLLEDATGRDRSWILAHPDHAIQGPTLETLDELVARRAGHEPLSYIRGRSEFYGREFIVNEHTLEPRPETETMIALAIEVLGSRLEVQDKKPLIADIGTGCGCIAITTKLEFPELGVIAIDIDEKCIKTARQNAKKLGATVKFLRGNLLEPIYNLEPRTSNLFALLANLPYVPDKYELNEAAKYEPRHAIFGGEDGLDLYRNLFSELTTQSPQLKARFVLTESLPFQHEELVKIAYSAAYELEKTEDFIQVFKARF